MVVSTMARLWNGFIYDKAVASQKVSEKLNSITSKFKKTEVKETSKEDTNKEIKNKKTENLNDKIKEAVTEENKETSKDSANLESDFSFNKKDDIIDVEAYEVIEEKIDDEKAVTEENSKKDVHLGPDFSFNKKDDIIDAEAHEVTEEKLNEALNKEKRRDGHKNSDPNKKETGYRVDKKK